MQFSTQGSGRNRENRLSMKVCSDLPEVLRSSATRCLVAKFTFVAIAPLGEFRLGLLVYAQTGSFQLTRSPDRPRPQLVTISFHSSSRPAPLRAEKGTMLSV
jgi:hypothetical protein